MVLDHRLKSAMVVPVAVLYPVGPVSGILPVLLPDTYRHYSETTAVVQFGATLHVATPVVGRRREGRLP